MSKAMRLFLVLAATLIWVGIWHTGFDRASWVLYVLAVMFPFAALTGICPAMIVSRRLVGERGT